MARKPKSALVTASGKHLYHYDFDGNTNMPWEEIEEIVGVSFSDQDRQEIFDCTEAYSREKIWYDAGVPVAELKELRDGLLKHSKAICDLAERYQPLSKLQGDEKDSRVIEALTQLHSHKGFAFFEEFHNTAIAAGRLVYGLQTEAFSAETSSRSGNVLGLETFIAKAFESASSKRARTVPRDTEEEHVKVFEYRRWGISIGPKSEQFRKFVSVVLKQKVSQDQITAAFPTEQDEHLNAVYDRMNDKGG